MSTVDLLSQRLHNQKLLRSTLTNPAAVVAWLGAVQSQDYPGAKWAVGQRAKGLTDDDIERAYDEGAILRTHVMRPTWHFVAPGDIRWMLELTAPRVLALMAYYDRQLELDRAVFKKSHAALTRALRGGRHLTRTELSAVLARAGIVARGQRLGHLMMRAELDVVICSGPMRGKQFTYALLEERVSSAPRRTRDEALAELTQRYFASHGPATVRDFAWWSGLTVADVNTGIASVRPALERVSMDGLTCWLTPDPGSRGGASPSTVARRRPAQPFAHLLSNYDEYGIAYKDRDAMVERPLPPSTAGVTEFPHLVIVNGKWVGSWKRTIGPRAAAVVIRARRKLTPDELRVLTAQAERYGGFLDLPTSLSQG